MQENDIADFIRLLKNLRGGITQIVKRYAKVNIVDKGVAMQPDKEQTSADVTLYVPSVANKKQTSTDIYYLDANNLYGGAVHRMIPYELVDIEDCEQVMKEANQDPNN